jgi:hypothetical protein
VVELTNVARAETIPVTVDEAAIDTAMRTRIGVSPEADSSTFQDALRRQLEATGLNETEYRRLVESETLETAIVDKFQGELPASLLQASVEVINTETREEAEAARDRVNGGEAFADVAREVSLEPTAEETGGVKEYGAEGSFNAAYDAFAFSAEVGELSEPLPAAGDLSFYIVRVIDRSEQPVADDAKPGLARDEYTEWLATTRSEMESSGALVNNFEPEDQLEAARAVLDDATPRLIEQAEQQEQQQFAQETAIAELTQNPAPTAVPVTPGSEPSASPATPAASDGDIPTPPSQPVAPSVP